MEIIQIKNIDKSFGSKTIFKDLSLDITEGQCVGIAGENGIGKSVLFKMIAGIEDYDKGEIRVRGELVGGNRNFPENIGYFVNQPKFVEIFTGFENLKYLAEIKNIISDDKIKEAMTRLGLDPADKTKVKNYSTGMKQKLGIAQAIMEDQEIIILDEPFNALDNKSNTITIEIINELKEAGKTILLTSHQEECLKSLCNEIYLVDCLSVREY